MASFLFWNLCKNRIEDRVARLVARHEIDVLMLAEFAGKPAEMVSAIENLAGSRYDLHGDPENKVRVFSRLPQGDLIERFSDIHRRMSISKMYLPGEPEILLVVAHFPSQRDHTSDDLGHSATEWARQIRRVETDVGHRRTVLVGDLNMNPFDHGMVSGQGLHAVMTRSKAREKMRRVNGKRSPFFYNPMWGLFGDRTPGPPGTYYLRSRKTIDYFWNMYDQVLVRPDLINRLRDLAILDHDGHESLLTSKGVPDKVRCSDHLPIMFRLVRERGSNGGLDFDRSLA